jgi:hypothetical protein
MPTCHLLELMTVLQGELAMSSVAREIEKPPEIVASVQIRSTDDWMCRPINVGYR